jgi:16S rRNA G966 N2-methylase RsmD
MWSYYGTKKALAKHYPFPKCDTIIEPFAGAAQYSLYGDNWRKNVILIDKYDIVIDIWNYLKSSTKSTILSLPDIKTGQNINTFTELAPVEKQLIGFCINACSSQPKKTAKDYNSWSKYKTIISDNIHKIKHWTFIQGEYTVAPDIEATWFIDPPYQYGGEYYRYSNKHIDFINLGKWSMNRNGQVIVCENDKADWLKFEQLKPLNGQLHKTNEVIYYHENLSTPYNDFIEF